MDGKEHFKQCCKNLNIDCKTNFKLGAQNPKKPNVWEYKCLTPTTSQVFAVCYFKAADIYIAWSLKERLGNKKSVFTVKKDDINILDRNKVYPARKNIEYSGRGKETVFTFCPEATEEFIKLALSIC